MRLLLDTHTFLWFIEDSPQLSAPAKALIEDSTNDVFLSMASVWEMAIKIGLGKLSISGPFDAYIPEQLRLNNIGLLDIAFTHVAEIIALPLHHRDPFDRLIIAQAHVEGIPIVGADTAFDAYPVTRLW